MKLPELVRKLLRRKKSGADAQSAPGENRPPKNGPLTLAVGASIMLMLVLGFTNLRLIRDPSVACKAFRFSVSTPAEPFCSVAPDPLTGTSEKKPPCAPPEVTFYNTLTAQDEPKPGEGTPTGGKIVENDLASDAQKIPASSPTAKKEDSKSGPQNPTPAGLASSPRPPHTVKSERSPKAYTVQVGAFSHPGIAQQWAQKWKARGFDVTLKPVARPRTGVIYRLYLGNFPSEKKADELVERLKTKEGISAFSLLVQN